MARAPLRWNPSASPLNYGSKPSSNNQVTPCRSTAVFAVTQSMQTTILQRWPMSSLSLVIRLERLSEEVLLRLKSLSASSSPHFLTIRHMHKTRSRPFAGVDSDNFSSVLLKLAVSRANALHRQRWTFMQHDYRKAKRHNLYNWFTTRLKPTLLFSECTALMRLSQSRLTRCILGTPCSPYWPIWPS